VIFLATISVSPNQVLLEGWAKLTAHSLTGRL
jgi:hypothetical protein